MAGLIWKFRLVRVKWKDPSLGFRHTWVYIWALSLSCCVILGSYLIILNFSFLNYKVGTVLLRSLWELNKVICIQFPYLYLVDVNTQYVANYCCSSCNCSHHCGVVFLNGPEMTSVQTLGEFVVVLFAHIEDDVSAVLHKSYRNKPVNYFCWRHLGNAYYKWGNNGPKLSARVVNILSYPRNLWTSSSNHPGGRLIIEMNIFLLNQYSWGLFKYTGATRFNWFFKNISDVFLYLFFSIFICLFFLFFYFKLLDSKSVSSSFRVFLRV